MGNCKPFSVSTIRWAALRCTNYDGFLVQGTDLLMLDKPKIYLDMAHQLELLNLLKKLNQEEERTIVMVIYDLNHASRFSDHMIKLKVEKLMKQGIPYEVMISETLRNVFEVKA